MSKSDIDAHLTGGAVAPAALEFNAVATPGYPRADETVKIIGLRRKIAEKMVEVADTVDALDLAGDFDRIWAGIEPLVRSQPRPNHTDRAITSAVQRTANHLVSFPEDARQDACRRVPSTCR